jgi:hypothetical protein
MNNMKGKLLGIFIILLVLMSTLLPAGLCFDDSKHPVPTKNPTKLQEIRVAIYTDEKEDENFYGPYGRTRYFVWALNYSWQVGDTIYRFDTSLVPTSNILAGDLTVDMFDVLIYPPDTYDEYVFSRALKNLPRNKMIAQHIRHFVEEGGGYFGTCGGALIAGDMRNTPSTFFEKVIKNGMLHISCIDVFFEGSIPLLCQYVGESPDSVGPTPVHLMYSGFNQTDYDVNYHSGICLDVPIMKDNPIFRDFLQETLRVRWLGAPNYVLPDTPDRVMYVLATFPTEDMSSNTSTQNHYWRYTGNIRGFILGTIKGLLGKGDVHYWDNLGFLMKAYTLAGDWDMEDTLLVTNFSGKPFWTAEIYPNENGGRIVRCTGHPEHNVWWGGHIDEVPDTDDNTLFEGFYRWKDILPENETIEDEFSYNYWTMRRSVAWAAQIPDDALPPTP